MAITTLPDTMKAAVYHAGGTIRVETRPLPELPGAGELLVRVAVCGVCGSDVTTWYMDPRAPVVLGHEPAGEIIAVGERVSDFAVGDRVALHHHVPCMTCDRCRRGAFTLCKMFKQTRLDPAGMAEYVRVPADIVSRDILKLPDDMPYEVGALVEPVACCVRALDRSNIRQGDTVVVIGAGFNGLIMGILAARWGADRVAILDLLPRRLVTARQAGLTGFDANDSRVVDQVLEWAGEDRAQTVIVTVSNQQALDMGLELAGPGATLMMYAPPKPGAAWPLDANRVFFQEIYVTGSYSAGPYDTRRALSLLHNKILDAGLLITHRFPLDRADEAWNLTREAKESLKVMVEINV